MATWDANFEANPEDTDDLQYGANEIRTLKEAVRERANVEHYWANDAANQGKHRPGKTGVLLYANTADIGNATLAQYGIVFDTTTKLFKYYTGAALVTIDIDHGSLSGANDDDHPQYLHLTKANQSIANSINVAANITIDGRDISVDGAKLDTFSTYSYMYYTMYREVQAPDTDAGNITTSWANRTLNATLANGIANLTRANSVLSIPPGTYRVYGSFPGYGCGLHQARLFNLTSNATILEGTTEDSSSYGTSRSVINGAFQILGSNAANVVVQHVAESNKATTGMGRAANLGANEIYGLLEFWKLGV